MLNYEGRREFERTILSQMVAHAAQALDFNESEWEIILFSHDGGYSLRLQMFGDMVGLTPDRIADTVYKYRPSPETEALAKRIEALPKIVRLALADVVDRFWHLDIDSLSMAEMLEELGVPLSAHARMSAAAILRRLDL